MVRSQFHLPRALRTLHWSEKCNSGTRFFSSSVLSEEKPSSKRSISCWYMRHSNLKMSTYEHRKDREKDGNRKGRIKLVWMPRILDFLGGKGIQNIPRKRENKEDQEGLTWNEPWWWTPRLGFLPDYEIEKMFHGVFVSSIEEWNHITQENDQSSDAGIDERQIPKCQAGAVVKKHNIATWTDLSSSNLWGQGKRHFSRKRRRTYNNHQQKKSTQALIAPIKIKKETLLNPVAQVSKKTILQPQLFLCIAFKSAENFYEHLKIIWRWSENKLGNASKPARYTSKKTPLSSLVGEAERAKSFIHCRVRRDLEYLRWGLIDSTIFQLACIEQLVIMEGFTICFVDCGRHSGTRLRSWAC